MALIWADRVAATTTSTGTGDLALLGAITGYVAFSSVCTIGDKVIYTIEAVDGSGVPTGDWEIGIGTYSASATLTRTTVIKSSNSNALVTLAIGTKNVFLDDIASTRNTLQQYSGTSEPSAPVEGLINFAKDFNGWAVPYVRAATGRSGAMFPYLTGRPIFGKTIPSPNATTMGNVGITGTLSGASATATVANTSSYTRFARLGISTTATASTIASIRDSGSSIFARGTGTYDGFKAVFRFGLESVGNTNCRYFVGLINSANAQAATFDPATTGQIEIGIGCTGTDTTNMKLYYNDNAGAPSTVDLGSNYPAKTAQAALVELQLWAAASDSSIKYLIRRLDDLTIASTTGSLTTDIPTAGTQLNMHAIINNNATAATSILGWGGFLLETGI